MLKAETGGAYDVFRQNPVWLASADGPMLFWRDYVLNRSSHATEPGQPLFAFHGAFDTVLFTDPTAERRLSPRPRHSTPSCT